MRLWFVRPDKTQVLPLFLRGMTRSMPLSFHLNSLYQAVQTRRALKTLPLFSNYKKIFQTYWLYLLTLLYFQSNTCIQDHLFTQVYTIENLKQPFFPPWHHRHTPEVFKLWVGSWDPYLSRDGFKCGSQAFLWPNY